MMNSRFILIHFDCVSRFNVNLSIEENIVNGLFTPKIVVLIIFRSISHHLFNVQERWQEIQSVVVSQVAVH